MRQYEAMYIVDADLSDEQLEAILEKYKKIVTTMGGVVLDAGKWEGGRRRLAYPIAGRREGIYILMNFDSGTDVPKELDRVFKISDDVFRHLIVKREVGAPPMQSAYQPQQQQAVAPPRSCSGSRSSTCRGTCRHCRGARGCRSARRSRGTGGRGSACYGTGRRACASARSRRITQRPDLVNLVLRDPAGV